jgi:hypothetical protein
MSDQAALENQLQELRDDRAGLLQTLREAHKLIKVLIEAHEEIERDHAIGMFPQGSLDDDKRMMQEIAETLRG